MEKQGKIVKKRARWFRGRRGLKRCFVSQVSIISPQRARAVIDGHGSSVNQRVYPVLRTPFVVAHVVIRNDTIESLNKDWSRAAIEHSLLTPIRSYVRISARARHEDMSHTQKGLLGVSDRGNRGQSSLGDLFQGGIVAIQSSDNTQRPVSGVKERVYATSSGF